jgi:hypothetical protein
MYCVENPRVIGLAPNSPAQDVELSNRTVVLAGTTYPTLEALRILRYKVDAAVDRPGTPGSDSTVHRPLLAPYGRYRPLVEDDTNLVAIYVSDSGRIQAFGPFESDIEAYDYFPDHSSPHDTLVAVFAVPALAASLQ